MDNQQPKPRALLLMSPQCSHCPSAMESLTRLLKEGLLGAVEFINLYEHPEIAGKYGVRAVPWMRIGPFELEGAQSLTELREWVQAAADDGGMTLYYNHLLASGRLERVVHLIREAPSTLVDLILLIDDPDTPMAVRIGIGAVVEELSGSPLLDQVVPELIRLTHSPEQQVRADACHFLSLSRSADALAAIQRLTDDQDQQVREIAQESAASLEARLNHSPQD